MDPRARAALERRGYGDHGHRARAFETAWMDDTDLVVCMDRGHRQTLAAMARARAGDYRHDDRLVLLRSFDPRAGGDVDVPDPYYGDDAEFERCLDLVEAGCRGLVAHLAGPTAARGRAGDDRCRAGRARDRIAVHGASGSGKTTLATALAARLGVARAELDALFHQPGWTRAADRPSSGPRCARVVAGAGLGGRGELPARCATWCGHRAQLVVVLDLPRWRVDSASCSAGR